MKGVALYSKGWEPAPEGDCGGRDSEGEGEAESEGAWTVAERVS